MENYILGKNLPNILKWIRLNLLDEIKNWKEVLGKDLIDK
jgi:hypothetical protein